LFDINAIATYEWEFGDGGTANTRNTQHTYVAAGTYIVTLTVKDTVGCHGSVTHEIVVTVPPVAHFSANTDNCLGQPVQFTNLSTSVNGYNTLWVWDFGDGNTQTVAFPDNPDVNHTYAQTGTYAVTLTVTNSFGCTDSETKTIIVTNGPQADFMYAGHCEGSPVSFTDLTTGSSTVTIIAWEWNFGDPGSGINNSSTLQNPTHSYANPGTYTVQLTTWSNNGCESTVSKTITISAEPPVDFLIQGSCENTPVHFVPGSVINTNTVATWFWQFGDGGISLQPSPYHTYTSAGTYTVTLTISDTAGCSNAISHIITVVPAPFVNFGYTAPGCAQSEVTFTDFTSVPAGYITQWIWNFGDGTSQTVNFPSAGTITHIYANAGTFNVSLTVKTSDSCSSSTSKIITISPKPSAAFTFTGGCQDAAVAFHDISNGNGAAITGRMWDFGDPASGAGNYSTLANPTHIYTLAGTYTVELIVTTSLGCSDTITQTVTIAPPPFVNFSSIAGCNGDTTIFNSSSFVNMATTVSWLWQFGDGQTSTLPDPVHVYASSGTYTVTLTIVNNAGCPATKTLPVTVTPGPIASFVSSSPSCAGSSVVFTDLSTYNSGSITQWHWTFGDGNDTTYTSFTSSINHVYTQAGNFMVKLTVYSQNGCENTYQQLVTIGAAPLAGFSWQNTCEGASTQFTDESVATSGISIVSRFWNFGDPTTGIFNTSSLLNPVHTFSDTGTYTVTLITVNGSGCSDTIQKEVIITPKPGVDFYFGDVTCMETPLAFTTDTIATNIATIASFSWNFGDGSATSSAQNPVHTYTNSGTFTVTLTVTDLNGCINSISHEVTIGESPVSMFSYANSCQDSPTQFTDLSLAPNNGTIVSWYWNFGVNSSTSDTSVVQNPSFTYTLPGIYTVTLTTTSSTGCTNSKSQPVQIFNTPTAAFKYSTSPCSNGSVQFQDSSYSYQSTITSWLWEFEPFQYSSARNPEYQYYAVDSCYDVKLIVTDFRGCVDTVVKQVCVPDKFAVEIAHQPSCIGTATPFSALLLTPSGDVINSYQWNFGDPASGSANTSTLSNPAHVFNTVGFYTVSLTATDIYGCQTAVVETIEVFALPEASFTWSNTMFSTTVDFTSTSTMAATTLVQYIWNFGDGTTQTLLHPDISVQHVYAVAGNYTVTLTIVDKNGCTSSQSQLVICSPMPAAGLQLMDTLICQNYALTIANLSTHTSSINQWIWNWGDGSAPVIDTVYKPTITHTYTQPGVYTITMKIVSIYNGMPVADSVSSIITVKPTPVANFASTGSCASSRVNFFNSTNPNGAPIANYYWNFGDPATANDTSILRNPYYSYPSAGEYEAQLIAVSSLGCSDTVSNKVNLYGSPAADFTFSVACMGQSTYFFDQSDPALAPLTHSGWIVSDGKHTIGKMTGPSATFTFDSLGVYTVLHAVSDTNGCSDSLTYKITVVPSPYSVFNVNDNFENIQGQVQLENGSIGANEYFWDFGNGETSGTASPVITFDEDGEYLIQLYAKNEYGCVDSTAVLYKMLYKGLWVPNAFSVGPVQEVRLWKPIGVNLTYYKAEVYNRWGDLLWKSTKLTEKGAPAEGWDGTFNEKPCQEGVYVWKIEAIFSDGSIWWNDDVGNREGLSSGRTGTITLIR
jgi:PKD repeat protein